MQLVKLMKRAFIIALIFIVGSGCYPKPEVRKISVAGTKKTQNVLLISIDTLRADHLGCYGYNKINTPNIDQLAREGLQFTSCYTPAPITLPSHATLMTGQYPLAHGVRDNGTFRLGDESVTLAEIFKSRGYQTAAFVGAFVLDSRFGLDQGFDLYDDNFESERKKTDLLFEERRAEEVIGAALAWLADKKTDPFFLWIHCFDPHAPYDPPAAYNKEQGDCSDPAHSASCYDEEINYVDDCLGKLFQKMKEQGIYDNTLICFTADHGEGLGEHGEPSHSIFVYDSTLHVPLIVRYPKKIAGGEVIQSQVSGVDIAPTILDLLGISLPDSAMQGRPLWKGGVPSPGEEAMYCETYSPFYDHRWSPLEGVRTAEWKYVKAPRPELYHLTDDPDEFFNLYTQRNDQAKGMEKLFAEIKKKYSPPEDSKTKMMAMDPETRQKLERLGYICTAPAENPNEAVGNYPDPKDMVIVLSYFNVAAYHYTRGNYDKALEAFKQSLEIDPRDVFAHFMIGFIYNKKGRFQRARDEFLECIRLDPGYLNGHVNLASVYLKLGQRDKAFQEIEEARKLHPDSVEVYQNLGVLYSQEGEYDKAIEAYSEALRMDDSHVDAMNGLANVSLMREDYPNALQYIQKAIELDNQDVDLYNTLGTVYLAQGKVEDAENNLKTALKLDPNRADTLMHLVDVHIQKEKYDLARQEIARAQAIDPNMAKVYNSHGVLLIKEGNYSEALPQFQRALQLEPKSSEVYYNLALIYSHLDDFDQALQALQRSVELDPKNHRSYASLGVIFYQQKKFPQAIEAYRSALKLKPENYDLLFQLALTCQDGGDTNRAIELYKQLLSKDPDNLKALTKISLLYFATGQTDLGVEECKRILELDPTNEAAHINLGLTFFRQKEFDRAILEYNQAIKNNPDNPVSYFQMANCYLWKQDIPKGVECLKETLRLKPDFQPAKQLLDQIQNFLQR